MAQKFVVLFEKVSYFDVEVEAENQEQAEELARQKIKTEGEAACLTSEGDVEWNDTMTEGVYVGRDSAFAA
jgi:hypothetical protein